MISERLARWKSLTEFSANRVEDYMSLLSVELSLYRASLLSSLCSCIALTLTLFATLAFVSVAAIVSFWDSEYRTLVSWWIAGGWLVISFIALYIAVRNAPGAPPLAELGRQARLDIAAVRGHYEKSES